MSWDVRFLEEARKDLRSLSGNQQKLVAKAIEKVRQNPLPAQDGGYGKPLGNKNNLNLTGLQKIKLKNSGLRVVYKVIQRQSEMLIIVIGVRSDEEVYKTAGRRIQKYDL